MAIHRRNKPRSAPWYLWLIGWLWMTWDRAIDRGWSMVEHRWG